MRDVNVTEENELAESAKRLEVRVFRTGKKQEETPEMIGGVLSTERAQEMQKGSGGWPVTSGQLPVLAR